MDFILEMARDAKVDFIRVLNRCHFEYSLVGLAMFSGWLQPLVVKPADSTTSAKSG